jgi:hypothetical protein
MYKRIKTIAATGVFAVLYKSQDKFSSDSQLLLPAWHENVMILGFEPVFFALTKSIYFATRPVNSRYKPVHFVTNVAVKLPDLQRTTVQ